MTLYNESMKKGYLFIFICQLKYEVEDKYSSNIDSDTRAITRANGLVQKKFLLSL